MHHNPRVQFFAGAIGFPAMVGTIQPACSQTAVSSVKAPPPEVGTSESADPIRPVLIGGGDLLKVSVLGVPESDQEVRVAEDGNISLNFIGSVHVAGLTTCAAQELIAKKLVAGGFFTQPQVSVFAKEYATQGVSVLGEVQKPGFIPCSVRGGCLTCSPLPAGPARKQVKS